MNRQSIVERFKAAERDGTPTKKTAFGWIGAPVTAQAFGAFWAASGVDVSWDDLLWRFSTAEHLTGSVADLGEGFFGTPPALHFVGFSGDEYHRAVKVFGRPDFIHRLNDDRFRYGGEVAPHDTVVFANGAESRPAPFSRDDSSFF